MGDNKPLQCAVAGILRPNLCLEARIPAPSYPRHRPSPPAPPPCAKRASRYTRHRPGTECSACLVCQALLDIETIKGVAGVVPLTNIYTKEYAPPARRTLPGPAAR